MSTNVLVMGESGSGKSRSIKSLDPKTTFLINVIGKPLPFRGWNELYTKYDEKKGNLFVSDNWSHIQKMISHVSDKLPQFKTIVIDDMQYLLANEYMRRAKEKGYEKFAEFADHYWQVIWECCLSRVDLVCVILSHSETTDMGKIKAKTIGKMLDEKICVEGLFVVVLHSKYEDGKYFFDTQTDGFTTAKSPEEMFKERRIDNDLSLVVKAVNAYNKAPEPKQTKQEVSNG